MVLDRPVHCRFVRNSPQIFPSKTTVHRILWLENANPSWENRASSIEDPVRSYLSGRRARAARVPAIRGVRRKSASGENPRRDRGRGRQPAAAGIGPSGHGDGDGHGRGRDAIARVRRR
jgi:hypothetical protein